MPRYVPDPTKVSIGFTVFPSGIYRVQFSDPKSFAGGKPDKPNYGVRYGASKVVESNDHPELVGKVFPQTLYMHSEGAEAFSKQVQAAVLGETKDEDFNAKYGSADWSFNTDDQSCGEGWHLLKGQVVDIECGEPEPNPTTGDLQTKIIKYRPVTK